MKWVIKKSNYSQKRLWTKLQILVLINIILFIYLISSTTYAEPFNCNVKITIDKNDIIYIIKPNCTYEFIVSGNVSCEFSGVGEDFQYIEVHLWAGSYYNWDVGVGPSIMIFNKPGIKRINLTAHMPYDVHNDTENVITISCYWEAGHAKGSALGASGSPNTVTVNVTVYRTFPIDFPNTITPEYDEPSDWADSWGYLYIITIVSIPVIIIIILIGIYLYRRKKWKEFLDEEKQ